jgi:hypothetical protein
VLRQQLIGDTIPITSTTNQPSESKTKPKSTSSVKRNSKKLVPEIFCEDRLEDIVNSGANIITGASD